jgi:ADP-ribosylglycohydrolase
VSSRERAVATLEGLAIGDALGMPTQSLSRERIAADHGAITGFVAPGPHQRVAAGMPAGAITDDTEQALLLARLLIDGGGRIDPHALAAALIEWEARMIERGSLDLLGPSTRAALQRLREGEPPEEAGRFGATNGAAMRIAPVGIASPVAPLAGFVDEVVSASALTHNTGLGIAAAAAVGAAVSAGVEGASTLEALDVAAAAAREGMSRGHWVAGGDIADRLEWAVRHLLGRDPAQQDDALAGLVGTSVAAQESVVAALALAGICDDPWEAVCRAASLGGDTDTMASIAGAVLGATGADWPAEAAESVTRVNGLRLAPVADALLELRRKHG